MLKQCYTGTKEQISCPKFCTVGLSHNLWPLCLVTFSFVYLHLLQFRIIMVTNINCSFVIQHSLVIAKSLFCCHRALLSAAAVFCSKCLWCACRHFQQLTAESQTEPRGLFVQLCTVRAQDFLCACASRPHSDVIILLVMAMTLCLEQTSALFNSMAVPFTTSFHGSRYEL